MKHSSLQISLIVFTIIIRKGDDGKERELHVQQSIDCTKVPADLDQNKLFVNTKLDHGSRTRYLKCEYLTVDHYLIEGSTEIKNDDPFQLVSVIDGEGTVNDMPIKRVISLLSVLMLI